MLWARDGLLLVMSNLRLLKYFFLLVTVNILRELNPQPFNDKNILMIKTRPSKRNPKNNSL